MADPKFVVLAHIQNVGDVTGGPGEFVGRRGQKRRMEGFSVTLTPPVDGIGLRYLAHISHSGDTWAKDGEFVGSRGRSRAVEGFSIELTGPNLSKYDVEYMAHIGYRGDTAWMSNGEFCGTRGHSLHAEGMAVKIVPRKPNYIAIISRAASNNGAPLVITAPEDPQDRSVRASSPDGSDYQLWDRRPVKGGQGFALISKARPGLCIARGSQPPVELKPATLIDTDPTCVWRDDGVRDVPPYNAINNWTDWEQKLHISGGPPFLEERNLLITHPWSHRADHELWRQSHATYHVVAGTDSEALYVLSKAIYEGCYPNVFKGQLGPFGDIRSIAYDILEAPVIEVKRSALLERHVRERYAKLPGVTAENVEKMAAEVAASTLTVTIRRMPLVVVDQNGTRRVDASLEMAAKVQWHPDRSISIELSVGELSIPADPLLALQLALFVAGLIAVLNLMILSRIRIPPLELFGVEFAPPVLETVQPHVLASTTILPDTSERPPPSRWPRDKVFVGFDDFALNAVARPALAALRPSLDWHPHPINVGICHLDVHAHAEVTLRNPVFTRTPRENTYTLHVELTGSAYFRMKCGDLPALTVSASASGGTTLTASVSIDAGNHVSVTLRSVDAMSLNWQFMHLPLWLTSPMAALILKAFEPDIRMVVSAALKDKSFNVYRIPTITADIAGKTFDITLRELALGRGEDGDEKPLVLATGTADVKMR